LRIEASVVNTLPAETLLEVGYFDDSLKRLLRPNLKYMGIDPEPTKHIEGMPITPFEDFKTKEKFDVVVASNILEHLTDPVKAFKRIRELSNKYVFISLPHEPWYTITRLFVPEEEHYWTIHPSILAHYFGRPIYEKYIHLRRTYIAVYKLPPT
jgi:hypothetical protein